jgi:hypothetical protein
MTGKSGKQIERCVISSFQVAESMGFKGDFRQWEHLLGSEIDELKAHHWCSERLRQVKRLPGNPDTALPGNRRAGSLLFSASAALLLPRIVLWIHVNDILGAYTMNLDDGFFASPDEVIGLGLHDCGATGG